MKSLLILVFALFRLASVGAARMTPMNGLSVQQQQPLAEAGGRPPGSKAVKSRVAAHRRNLDARFAHHRAHFDRPPHERVVSDAERKIRPRGFLGAAGVDDQGYANVLDFGAKGDGTTDDTAAFQNALDNNQKEGHGGLVFVPAGNYLIGGVLTIPSYTLLQGVDDYPPVWKEHRMTKRIGTVLYATYNSTSAAGKPFISMTNSAGVKGMSIFYPGQSVHATRPNPFPPCIQGSGNDLSVEDMMLVNPTVGIDFHTYSCPRHMIANVYGQPLEIGVKIDMIYDIGRIRHCHFWSFFASSTQPLWIHWVQRHAITFLFARSDWEVVEDVFSWGYHRGMVFTNSAVGSLNGQFSNIDFDNVDVGIYVNSTQRPGILFSNLNLANADNGGGKPSSGHDGLQTAIVCAEGVQSDGAEMSVSGLSVWGQFKSVVQWDCSGVFTMSNSLINQWAITDHTGVGLAFSKGIVSVQNNYFGGWGMAQNMVAWNVSTTVEAAIITNNIVDSKLQTVCPDGVGHINCLNNVQASGGLG